MDLNHARETLRERIYDMERAQHYFEAERLRLILASDAATLAWALASAPPARDVMRDLRQGGRG